MEIIVILIIILILVGGWRLPKIGESLGRTVGYFKKGMSEPKKENLEAKKDDSGKTNIEAKKKQVKK